MTSYKPRLCSKCDLDITRSIFIISVRLYVKHLWNDSHKPKPTMDGWSYIFSLQPMLQIPLPFKLRSSPLTIGSHNFSHYFNMLLMPCYAVNVSSSGELNVSCIGQAWKVTVGSIPPMQARNVIYGIWLIDYVRRYQTSRLASIEPADGDRLIDLLNRMSNIECTTSSWWTILDVNKSLLNHHAVWMMECQTYENAWGDCWGFPPVYVQQPFAAASDQ